MVPHMQTLQQYLEARGLTQVQFAARVGRAHTTVGRWCSGQAFPSPGMIRRINEVTAGAVPPQVWYETGGASPAPRTGARPAAIADAAS